MRAEASKCRSVYAVWLPVCYKYWSICLCPYFTGLFQDLKTERELLNSCEVSGVSTPNLLYFTVLVIGLLVIIDARPPPKP